MANKWRTATGNWSNAAQWNGGVLPSPGDDCYANGFTCTIDIEDLEYNLTTEANAGIGVSAGGGFSAPASSINIVHRGNAKCATSNCITVSSVFLGTWTHESGTYEGGVTTSSRYPFYWASGAPRLTLKGEYKAGTVSNNYTYITPSVEGGSVVFDDAVVYVVGAQTAVYINSNITLSVTGTYSAPMSGGSAGVALQVNGTGVTAVLTCTQAIINSTYRIILVSGAANVELTVLEFVFNSVTYSNAAVGAFHAFSNGYLKVIAPLVDLTPYPLTNLTWVYADSGGVIDYIGDVVCGYGASSYVFRTGSSGNVIIRHTGIFYGPTVFTLTSGAYSQVSTSMIVLDEVRAGDGGLPTLSGIIRLKSTGVLQIKEENGMMHSFVNSDEVGDPPAVTNVRDGVRYHFDTLEGTLVVPLPSTVLKNVPTDNTVGTAIVQASAYMTQMNSRMKGGVIDLFLDEDIDWTVTLLDADGAEVDIDGDSIVFTVQHSQTDVVLYTDTLTGVGATVTFPTADVTVAVTDALMWSASKDSEIVGFGIIRVNEVARP